MQESFLKQEELGETLEFLINRRALSLLDFKQALLGAKTQIFDFIHCLYLNFQSSKIQVCHQQC